MTDYDILFTLSTYNHAEVSLFLHVVKKFSIDVGTKTKTHMQMIKSLPVVGQEKIADVERDVPAPTGSSQVISSSSVTRNILSSVANNTQKINIIASTPKPSTDMVPKKVPAKRKRPSTASSPNPPSKILQTTGSSVPV